MIDGRHFALGLLAAVCVGCGGGAPPAEAPPPEPPAPAVPTAEAPPAEDPKPVEPEAPPAPKPVVTWKDGLSTPESVLVDGDRYLVSNIDGKPLDVDGNGFISELAPDGKVLRAKFIAGGENKVKLDAPKGMGIVKGILYVADITRVRKFDAKSGAPKGEIAIKGATFLNDIAVAEDGRIFVSDTGMKAGEKDFEPTGTDAIYVIDKAGRVKAYAKGEALTRPNGLLATADGVLVAPFGSNEVSRFDAKGERQDATALPKGGLDGIVAVGDSLLVSSWQGSAVYRGKLGGTFEPVLWDVKAPADIAYDSKLGRVLVPRFMDNAVEAYEIK